MLKIKRIRLLIAYWILDKCEQHNESLVKENSDLHKQLTFCLKDY